MGVRSDPISARADSGRFLENVETEETNENNERDSLLEIIYEIFQDGTVLRFNNEH